MADQQSTQEQWLPVPGWEGAYEVSNLGRVRSVTRKVWNGRAMATRPGRVLKGGVKPAGYPYVNLCRDKDQEVRYIHELVLTTFVGERPSLYHVARHLNDVPSDNRLENLRWGTESDNMFDQSRNGGNHWRNRDSCKNGHKYTPENTRIRMVGKARVRVCRECARADARNRYSSRKEYKRQWRAKRRAQGKPVT